MKRVEENGDWSLFCPAEAPGLSDCWGEKFEDLYSSCKPFLIVKMKNKDLLVKSSRLKNCGMPSWKPKLKRERLICSIKMLGNVIIYQKSSIDSLYSFSNRKSNQQNLGTIKCSNLCTEIVEYSAPDEVAVCNLASIALPTFVGKDNGVPYFDFDKLREVIPLFHSIGG